MKKTDKPITILVFSRHEEERERIISSLSDQNDFCIISAEKDESGAIIKSEKLKPDVLIMDLNLPGMSGPELAPVIRRRSPSTAIILLCNNDEDNYASAALKAGISGFLIKESDIDLLALAVKMVYSGGCYVSASIVIRVFTTVNIAGLLSRQTVNPVSSQILTPAERGIIKDIARGFSDDEIAKHLNYSTGTIRNFLSKIKQKTRMKNKIQIVLFSIINGLINLEQIDIFKNYRQFTNDGIQ
jgi:DNA-binding NarL/FixJ family response regulator